MSEGTNYDSPKWGTDEYLSQVDTIYTQFMTSPLEEEHLAQFLVMFIQDTSYNRAAICEAENKIRKERAWD